MKLFVILLCLLSERYLVHVISHDRFHWFASYFKSMSTKLNTQNASFLMIITIVPIILLGWIILSIAGYLLFGLATLALNVAIFFYCLGPRNPFYPARQHFDEANNENEVGNYFSQVNGQLFAVIFWYLTGGPLGALLYRLISLCRNFPATSNLALWLTNIFDWLPVRLTVFLYLLVGNFQRGIHFLLQQFSAPPEKNDFLLRNGGLLAARVNEDEPIRLPYAENLVEHALIVYLVFLSFFILFA